MLEEHLGYVADAVRLELYDAAIAKTVTAGDSVADLGCGSGILGLLSLKAGAGHVYAIDDSAMINIARETMQRGGCGSRVTFVAGRSGRIELPEPVDVLVCDHVGYFGIDYGVLEMVQDARHRFLKAGGSVIPARIRLQVAPVGADKCKDLADAWSNSGIPREFHWLREHSINAKHALRFAKEDLLGSPTTLGEMDLCADNSEFLSWKTELRIEQDGVMNGLAGWFNCELAKGVWMTNSPLANKSIKRSQVFLPISDSNHVRSGDVVEATIMARPADDLFAWTVRFPASRRYFSHSTWQGMLFSPESLIRANPNRVPRLSRESLARAIVLGYCDGKRTAQEIGQVVLHDHPDLFPSSAEILKFVLHVLGRDTE